MKNSFMLKTREREVSERQLEVKYLVEQTLRINTNITTYKQIRETTGTTQFELETVFLNFPELKAEFIVRRRSIASLAVDNIQEIIENPLHPQNFQASKFIVQTYKNELDDSLDAKVKTEVGFDVGNGETNPSPVRVTFSVKK